LRASVSGGWRQTIDVTSIVVSDKHKVFLDALAMVLGGRELK